MRHKYKISKCRNQSRLNFADPSYANQTGLRGWIRNIIHTGCCLNGGSVQPPSRSFPNVLSLFDHSIWAIFHSGLLAT